MFGASVGQIGGDANKMAFQRKGQQLGFSYGMSIFQFWLDRMERTVDLFLKDKIPGGIARDMNVGTFQAVSYSDDIPKRGTWRKSRY